MRICSLLPSATEIVCALGLAGDLVAVTHECDYPPAVADLPRITRSAVESDRLTSSQIDALVSTHLHEHRGIYTLDRDLLERLNPDLILTQELCDVCAVSYTEVQQAVRTLYGERTVLSLEPTNLAGVLDAILRVGVATGSEPVASATVARLSGEIDAIAAAVRPAPERPRVACIEWLDPPWAGGHWVPEMVRLAGGVDGLGEEGAPSQRTTWERLAEYRPDVIVLMPCGFDVERIAAEWSALPKPPGWAALPTVRDGRVWAVDANSYFSRPGPRLVEGLRILAHILHPDRVPPPADPAVLRRV